MSPEAAAATMTARTWHVYLLECENGSIYTGIAIDVEQRFAAHLSGRGARYTRMHRPLRVLAVLPFPDRAAATRAEISIKRLSAAAKRTLCTCRDPLAGDPVRPECATPAPDRSCPDP